MKIISLLFFYFLLVLTNQKGDSPHGSDFKIRCSTCHSSKGWELDKSIYSFDHNSTSLPLTGQHTDVSCRQCHPTLVFDEAGAECISCHNDQHQGTVGSDCARCHTPTSWLVENISVIHQLSRFPLLGAHRTADCFQCHKSESYVRFDVPGVNCIDCHRNDFLASTNPNHVESGMSEDCIQCHPVNSFQWEGAGFNHSFFALDQGHSSVKCADCHKTANYSDASPECFSCHEPDFLNTDNPNHSESLFSQVCTDCHTLSPGWKPTLFDHGQFPLTLGHAQPTCIECHLNGNYTTTPIDCYACHQQDFQETINPEHVASAFSINCLECHTTNPGWKPTTFNHDFFPLTLGHSLPACTDCHIGGNYTSTSPACYSCHQQEFLATTDPNHSTSGFSQTCTDCHTTNPGWKPTTFDHNSFPLTLGHSGPSCADCHKGNYTTTPTDCYACHSADFGGSVNPNHNTLGFSTNCKSCHTTNPDWKPASYLQHDIQFPIYSGKHQGEWNSCVDCHTNLSNYSVFSCLNCHEHNKIEMDSKHQGESGYSYSSEACYNCHPRGDS